MARYFKRDRTDKDYYNKPRRWVEIEHEEYKVMPKETVEVAVEVLEERDVSWLVSDGSDEDGVWIPKSQIEESNKDLDVGVHAVITIPEWLAKDRGLI